jgi:hypothetical protein
VELWFSDDLPCGWMAQKLEGPIFLYAVVDGLILVKIQKAPRCGLQISVRNHYNFNVEFETMPLQPGVH